MLPGSAAAAVNLVPVGGTFSDPVQVTAAPGDGRRVFVVEQGGTVSVIRDGEKLAVPFLSLGANGSFGGEHGLLSIAFSPNYEQSRLLYAYFTDPEGDIRVDEFRRAAGSRDAVEPGYRRTTIEIPHPGFGNHNGGTVAFGSDGHMYIGTGDGGGGYDPDDNGQRIEPAPGEQVLLGKLLRIDPIAGGGYSVPTSNPFTAGGNAGADEIFHFGLRNPFRFSFDRQTGDLFIGDVGQDRTEELDHVAAGTPGGLNFGWGVCEGTFELSNPDVVPVPAACPLAGQTAPELQFDHVSDSVASIIGGVVVRDPGLPELAGRYLFGDIAWSVLRSVVPGQPATLRSETGLGVTTAVGIGQDTCSRVYVAELGGTVSRVDDDTPGACPARVPEPGAAPPPPQPGPPKVTLGGSKRQRILRKRRVVVRVRCERPCSLRVLGQLRVPGRDRKMPTVKVARATGTVAVRLRIGRIGSAKTRRALRGHKPVRVALTIRARDDGGRLTVVKRSIRIVG